MKNEVFHSFNNTVVGLDFVFTTKYIINYNAILKSGDVPFHWKETIITIPTLGKDHVGLCFDYLNFFREGKILSTLHTLELGVPQGSIYSVTLFSIKINSITNVIGPNIFCCLYEDLLKTGGKEERNYKKAVIH